MPNNQWNPDIGIGNEDQKPPSIEELETTFAGLSSIPIPLGYDLRPSKSLYRNLVSENARYVNISTNDRLRISGGMYSIIACAIGETPAICHYDKISSNGQLPHAIDYELETNVRFSISRTHALIPQSSENLLAAIDAHIDYINRNTFPANIIYTPIYMPDGSQMIFDSDYLENVSGAAVKHLQALKTRNDPIVPARIISQLARGRSIMNFTPGSREPHDFDSGFCDVLSNTAFYQGQTVYCLPLDDLWAFVISNSQASFLPLSQLKLKGKIVGVELHRYIGPDIRHIEKVDTCLFSGDSFFMPRGENPDFETTKRNLSLTAAVEWFTKQRAPYTPNTDCSNMVKKFFALMGFEVPRSSRDISDYLSAIAPSTVDLSSESDIEKLDPGLYIVELYSLPTNAEGDLNKRVSQHMYIAEVDEKVRIVMHSQAFSIINDDNEVEYPVGYHRSSRESVVNYINRGKHFRFIKIGSPRN